jgi:methionyl-tRNA synthetase
MKMATSNGIIFDKEKGFFKRNDLFFKEYTQAIEIYNLQVAMDAIWSAIGWCDKSIQQDTPFKTIKTDKAKGEQQIQTLLYDLDLIADMLEPFLPETSAKIKAAIRENKMPDILFPRKD